jgi:hypothetical protein
MNAISNWRYSLYMYHCDCPAITVHLVIFCFFQSEFDVAIDIEIEDDLYKLRCRKFLSGVPIGVTPAGDSFIKVKSSTKPIIE